MRKEFINTLIKLAQKDKNIYLLTGDLGFSFLEEFAQKFPERFINCGIAEQNMTGVAAGLALEGKKPYMYSIIPFVVIRCLEQIRNDICYQNLNVKIIGAGAGFSYGSLGETHHAIEDIAILRSLPNITLLSPGDPVEMEELVLESYKIDGPVYIRMDKNAEKLYNLKPKIKIGRPNIINDGENGVLITTGSMLKTGIEVIKALKKTGVRFKLISVHTLKPINEKILLKELKTQKKIFTLEEHGLIGGLGSCIGEILLKNKIRNFLFEAIGVTHKHLGIIGKQEYLRKYHRINSNNVYKKIINLLNNESKNKN